MVEESAKEDWVRTLTERPLDREDKSWDVQVVGESGFTLLVLAVAADTDLSPGDRVAVESDGITDVKHRLTYHTLTQVAQERLETALLKMRYGGVGIWRFERRNHAIESENLECLI